MRVCGIFSLPASFHVFFYNHSIEIRVWSECGLLFDLHEYDSHFVVFTM